MAVRFNFFMACNVHPGRPPLQEVGREESERSERMDVSWCRSSMCSSPSAGAALARNGAPARLRSGMELRKAPRAHHSKRLGQCVARMDHDCATAFCKGFSTKHGAWPLQTCGF